jgi:hypothetical protein
MRLLLIASLFAALPAAAVPMHSGTWVVDPARVQFSDGLTPKNLQLKVELTITDDRFTYRSTNTSSPDRPPAVQSFSAPVDGTPAPITGQAGATMVSVKRLSANEYAILRLNGDDVVLGEFWTFQPDGRQVVRRGIARKPDGKARYYDEWFERR